LYDPYEINNLLIKNKKVYKGFRSKKFTSADRASIPWN